MNKKIFSGEEFFDRLLGEFKLEGCNLSNSNRKNIDLRLFIIEAKFNI